MVYNLMDKEIPMRHTPPQFASNKGRIRSFLATAAAVAGCVAFCYIVLVAVMSL